MKSNKNKQEVGQVETIETNIIIIIIITMVIIFIISLYEERVC